MTVDAIRPCYGLPGRRRRQPLTDRAVLGASVAALVGAWAGWWVMGAGAGLAAAAVVRALDLDARRWMLVAIVLVGAVAGARADQTHRGLVPVSPGDVHGWAIVVGDPRLSDRAARAVLRLDGVRLETWVREPAMRAEIARWRHGDRVLLTGEQRPLAPGRAELLAWQHVVGALRLTEVHGVAPPSPIDRFSNRVRRAVEGGASRLAPPHDSLFRGLVIGDRREQSSEVVDRFRASGLSHLNVASGMNVALLLAAASPLLCRLRPAPRWLVTVALVAWFASLTRFEPSIVRASVMAAIASTAFLLGRDRSPVRLLGIAVMLLVLVDPLLVRSLGFRLSVGATFGVAALGPGLARRLPGPQWFARPLGVTIGAQAGVAAPLVAGIGHVPVVSVPANLVAVPIAGLVKLYGLPASIVAGTVPALAGPLMAPCAVGVWWVDRVALIAADLEPGGAWSIAWWAVIAVVVGVVAVRPGR